MVEISWHRRETRRQTEKTNPQPKYREKPVYSTQSFHAYTVLGIAIAKQKFDVALLVEGWIKNKTCKNSVVGERIKKDWGSNPDWKFASPCSVTRIVLLLAGL